MTLAASGVLAGGSGLLGHWTLDEGAGGVARDSSGKGRHGKVHGAAWAKGKAGGALRFDGKDDYVSLGDFGQFPAVTVAFWMNARRLAAARGFRGLVSCDGWEPGDFHIPMQGRAVDAYLHLGGGRRGRLTSPKLKDGAWYHVAVTGDRALGEIRLFLNGVEADAADIHGFAADFRLIGMVAGREYKSRHFEGRIDDVRLYSRALSEKEVRALCPDAAPVARRDRRNTRTGHRIPNENYCDQPYVVVTRDGHWLCVMTTGPGREGHHGQHIISTISTDKGRTWSTPADIEPSDGPEASWVVPLVTPSGRVYAFYTYNGDDVRTLRGKPIRADVIGWYAYRYSDDGGRTWSKERYRLPMRLTACDRGNDWGGKVQIFWGISKPIVHGGSAIFAFTKLGKFMLDQGEGWFYRSDNILAESDVAKLRWELLPDGDHGVRAPEFGSVQEEHNIVALSDGSLYCVYRTTRGHPCHAYSRDGGHTWTKPVPMTTTPGGRRMKTPRACPQVWKAGNGKFLFWYHNHSQQSFRGRNPVWISGGVEKDGHVLWSQPEILLYDPNPKVGMSYPCLIEQDGRTWFTETQKTIARVHEADKTLLEGLWSQGKVKAVAREGLILELGAAEFQGKAVALPKRLDVAESGGLSLGLWLTLGDLSAGQVLVDSRDAKGAGLALTTTEKGTIQIELSDGETKAAWDCDPGLLKAGKLHHVAAIVDAAPGIITFVVDGVVCDGGAARTHGWTRYQGELGDVGGTGKLGVAAPIKRLRLYSRYLRTSEAIGNFHAGP